MRKGAVLKSKAEFQLAFLLPLFFLLGHASSAQSQKGPNTRLPQGMAAFFIYNSCPKGWRPVQDAAGRLVLGTTQAEQVGQVLGTPLRDGEDRTHQHSYDVSVDIPYQNLAGAHGGGNKQGTSKGNRKAHGTANEASANIPLVQFPLCESVKARPGKPTGSWPLGAVSFFTSPQCPDGWEPYDRAEGRFVVPTVSRDDRVGKVYGTPISSAPPAHQHDLSATFTTQKVEYILKQKFIWTNKNVAKHGKYTASGKTTSEPVDVPFVKLTICRVKDDPRARAPIPSGLMVFVGAQLCDTEAGWTDAPATKGRYLLGLPPDGEPGLTFGGNPLNDGELRAHTHDFEGSINLPTYSIAGAAGCAVLCARWYAGKGDYPLKDATKSGVVNLPYVALRQCLKR